MTELFDQFGRPLSLSQHKSTEHTIGEEIPAPTLILPNGATSSLGSSSIPAREDHRHSSGIPVFANTTARNAVILSPVYGDQAILDDEDVLTIYNGTKWIYQQWLGAWRNYTPFVSQGGGFLPFSNIYSFYKVEGNWAHWKAYIIASDSSAVAGNPLLVYPPIISSISNQRGCGVTQIYHGASGVRYVTVIEFTGGTGFNISTFAGDHTGNTVWGSAPVLAWSINSQLHIDMNWMVDQ